MRRPLLAAVVSGDLWSPCGPSACTPGRRASSRIREACPRCGPKTASRPPSRARARRPPWSSRLVTSPRLWSATPSRSSSSVSAGPHCSRASPEVQVSPDHTVATVDFPTGKRDGRHQHPGAGRRCGTSWCRAWSAGSAAHNRRNDDSAPGRVAALRASMTARIASPPRRPASGRPRSRDEAPAPESRPGRPWHRHEASGGGAALAECP